MGLNIRLFCLMWLFCIFNFLAFKFTGFGLGFGFGLGLGLRLNHGICKKATISQESLLFDDP